MVPAEMRVLIWIGLLLCAACSCDEDPAPTTSQRTPTPTNIPEARSRPAPPANAPEMPSRTRDLHGLRVTLEENGFIRLSGTDRWGGRVDTVYENAEFFRNAVPVLSRSVTEEQAADLRALAAELAPPPTRGP